MTSQRSIMPERNLCITHIKNMCSFVILVLLLCRTEGYSLAKHTKIDSIEHSCPELDTCNYSNETKLVSPTVEKNCACDAICNKFNDCCIDSLKLKGEKSDMKCHDVKTLGGVYMISKCKGKYEGDDSWRELCENMNISDPADPIGSVPVTDVTTNVTYKNVYCKLCNGKFDLMKFWKTKLDCPLLSSFNESHAITEKYVLKNLVRKDDTWGLILDISDENKFFFECNIETVIPSELRHKVRRCKPNLVSDCPSSWKNDLIRKKCKSFLGPRYTDDGDGYRNIYCAICNNVNAAELSCLSPQTDSIKEFRFSMIHSFALLLDVSITRGEKVGMIQLCKSAEVYDPFFKKCRELQCLPGFVRRGRKCFPRRSVSKIVRRPAKYRKVYYSTSKPVASIITKTLSPTVASNIVNYTKQSTAPIYETKSYTATSIYSSALSVPVYTYNSSVVYETKEDLYK